MAGPASAIRDFTAPAVRKSWVPGPSPAMTRGERTSGKTHLTRTSGTTDIPGANGYSRRRPSSMTIFTGRRWTILT